MIRGLDVSYWQIKMNWDTAAAQGVGFGAARCTVGNWADDSFPRLYNGGLANNTTMAPYHVVVPSYQGKRITADEQMDTFFGEFYSRADHKISFGIVLDCEKDNNEDDRLITALIEDCIDFIVGKGHKPIIYTSKGWWDDHVLKSSHWKEVALWVANYPYYDWQEKEQYHTFEEFELYYSKGSAFPRLPRDWDDWQIWQFSSQGTGKLYGAGSNYIDLNLAKDNFFTIPEPPPPPPPEDIITLQIPAMTALFGEKVYQTDETEKEFSLV